LAEIGFDEGIQIAIEDGGGIAGFDTGAEVFDEVIGVQHVTTDLRSPFDFLFAGIISGSEFFAAVEFELIQFGAQHFHGGGTVFDLRAFVLAGHHNASGEVGDAHGGIGDIDVLAAGAAGAVGVNAQIFVKDFDFDIVVNFSGEINGGEGGMAAFVGIKGGDAHKAVDAAFGFEIAEGIGAGDEEGGGFVAGFIAFEGVDEGIGKVVGIAPAGVHAEEHAGPVAGFGAAGAGVDGEVGVAAVEFAAEGAFEFEAFVCMDEGGGVLGNISGKGLVALGGGEFDEAKGISNLLTHCGARINELPDGAQFLEDGAGAVGVIPEIGRGGGELKFVEARRFGVNLQAFREVLEALFDFFHYLTFLFIHS